MEVPDFAAMSDETLLALIVTCGLDVPVGLPEAIVARGPAMVEPLCAIVADSESWRAGDDDISGWAPIHAMHLLGAIGDARAVDALLAPLAEENFPDIYLESGTGVLAHLGPEAIPALTRFTREADDEFAAYVAFQGLVGIGLLHPQHAHVARDLGRELVREALAAGGDVSALLATTLARIGDASDLEVLHEAYDDGRWSDYHYIRWEELERDVREGDDGGQAERATTDPMEHFSAESLRVLRRTQERWSRTGRTVPAPPHDYPVIGKEPDGPERQAKPSRNAPCPCGSGRKYKRCCGK